MKKYLLLILTVLLLFVVIESVFAYDNEIPTLPFTYNGRTYSDVFVYKNDYGGTHYLWVFYNQVSGYKIEPGGSAPDWRLYLLDNALYTGYYIIYHGGYNENNYNIPTTFMECVNSSPATMIGASLYANLFPDDVNTDRILTSQPLYDYNDPDKLVLSANYPAASAFQLTIVLDPEKGNVTSFPGGLACSGSTCQGTFPQGALVTLTASSDNGWKFNSWDDGNFNNPQNPLAIVMDDNKSIQALFTWNDKIILKAVDSAPLGNRTPLILAHGNNMETVNQFGWSNYINKFKNKKETAFQGMYKVYLFSSDSEQSNHYNGMALGQMIDSMPELANKSLTILAHSRGGLIARYFMNQYAMKSDNYSGQLGGEKVKWLVTLATPHRGSPGADPIWVEASLDYNFPYPINTNLYTIYFDGSGPILPIFSALYNPKSYQQLLWDDIDNKLTTQKVCYSIPLVTEECIPLMSKTVINDLSKFNQDERYYQKIVAYGGNNYTQSLYSKIMHAITSLAFLTSSGTKIWIQHNFLDLSTFLMERMPIIPPGYDRVTSNPERPFMANDGMVPLTSALFLRPGASEAITFNRNKLKYDNSFCQVAECHVVDGSIDHLGFLDDSSVLTFVLLKLKTLH